MKKTDHYNPFLRGFISEYLGVPMTDWQEAFYYSHFVPPSYEPREGYIDAGVSPKDNEVFSINERDIVAATGVEFDMLRNSDYYANVLAGTRMDRMFDEERHFKFRTPCITTMEKN